MRDPDPASHFVGIRALVCILVLTGVAVLMLTADFLQGFGIATDRDIVVDEELLGATVDRLTDVEVMVDALPSYPGTDSGSTTQRRRCLTSSGDLLQPEVSRRWALSDGVSADAVGEAVAADLADAGWRVEADVDGRDPQRMTFEASDGWTAVGSLFTYEADAVIIDVYIDGEQPCRIR